MNDCLYCAAPLCSALIGLSLQQDGRRCVKAVVLSNRTRSVQQLISLAGTKAQRGGEARVHGYVLPEILTFLSPLCYTAPCTDTNGGAGPGETETGAEFNLEAISASPISQTIINYSTVDTTIPEHASYASARGNKKTRQILGLPVYIAGKINNQPEPTLISSLARLKQPNFCYQD
ncbi:hypothetical protein J6590_020270 [Homalodisca vitripennis]|nr:hypothetical protein J6590_020270 [Homalodisca vitripennis]